MRIMRLLGWVVWAAHLLGLVGFSLPSYGTQTGSDTRPVNLTIKGVITNISEVAEWIKDDTYLQLILVPPDGKVELKSDGEGRITYISVLPKTAVPAKGSFSIVCNALAPGKYLVAVQMFKRSIVVNGAGRESVDAVNPQFWRPFLRKDKAALVITIPKDASGPILDVGQVTLPVPPR